MGTVAYSSPGLFSYLQRPLKAKIPELGQIRFEAETLKDKRVTV